MTVQSSTALRYRARLKGAARRAFPHFKRHSDCSDAFAFVGREVRVEPGRIRLPKVGWLRVRGMSLPDGARVTTKHVSRHKATRTLVDTHAGFAVEDLSFRALMRTRMAGSFTDAGLGEFIRTLRYKAKWAGRCWGAFPRFQRSSGLCPDYGLVAPRLALSVLGL